MTESQGSRAFQVDLRGLVDLLSHHLYSSPRVYIRELLQNGVDAVTARRAIDADAPGTVLITAVSDGIRIDDSGIGLTEAEVHDLLATIGRSSKRDGLAAARQDFLGRFGIGLLACFMVAAEIRVVSRSARTPDAATVEWRASDDGSYTVTGARTPRAEPGTTVFLKARPDAAEWLAADRVRELAADFGSLLPFDVGFAVEGAEPEPITDRPPVWERPHPSPTARRIALNAYCERTLGFTPLDVVDLTVPVAGVRGVGFIHPHATSPAQRTRNRVYLKGMLLTDRAEDLLPDWAFFMACVVDTDSLRPTASRENLYDDEMLATVRDALGGRVRSWLTSLAAGDPARLVEFLGVHHLGVKALARHDDALLSLLLPWLPFETSEGGVGLAEFARRHPTLYVTRTVEEFRQVAPIAAAQGIGVVNGGYTYDGDLVAALPRVMPGVTVSALDPDVVTASLDLVDPDVELAMSGFLTIARARLDAAGVDVALRAFHPVGLPALFLDDRAARFERDRAEAASDADDLWSGILGALQQSGPRARLVLNHRNPLVSRIAGLGNPDLIGTAVESLYGQALLMAQRPLRQADLALLNRSFLGLLEWVTGDHREAGQ
ncbi:HSP90 family protein [Stackebrandtia albiflava]|nr:HSP90 family protein [Stackebrandtia albiflava]